MTSPVQGRLTSETDSVKKGTEEAENKMLFEAEIKVFVERQDQYHSNKSNLYALIWKQCNKALQGKLQTHTNFRSEIDGDPIKLLNAIEEHSVSYEDKFPLSTVYDAMRNLLNIHQKEGGLATRRKR